MLHPIKAFNSVNSTIQNNTGYSFSFSHLSKNINKIALPAIALVGMYMSSVSAKEDFRTSLKDFDYSRACSVYSNHDDCINSCLKESSQYEDLLCEMSACVQMCTDYFPI